MTWLAHADIASLLLHLSNISDLLSLSLSSTGHLWDFKDELGKAWNWVLTQGEVWGPGRLLEIKISPHVHLA